MARNSERRADAVALLVLIGAVLCALAGAGLLLYRFYLLRPWVYHPILFGVPGCIALALACGLGFRRPVLKWPAVTVCVLAAAGTGLIGWLSTWAAEPTESSRHPAPDGSVDVVVFSGTAFMTPDPIWELRLHTKEGLWSREFDLGCVNGDMVALNSIDWIAARTVRVGLSGGVVDITVGADGRPDRTVGAGC